MVMHSAEDSLKQAQTIMYIEIAAFIVLIFVYLITLCQLQSSMQKLDEIEKERKSVLNQFSLFIVAYTT